VAHSKHEDIRRRYDFRCGYCGVTETDTGGQLTVDHYIPVSVGGDDSDENLVYACFRCNLFKSDFCPSDEESRQGRRLLHPQRDTLSDHYFEDTTTYLLMPRTLTGSVHIALLQLNRPELVDHRQKRWRDAQIAHRTEWLEMRLRQLAIQAGLLDEQDGPNISDTEQY
jgi:hypothetical protein